MSKKIAVVTGASRGIGRAIALKYAEMGFDVAICCRHNKNLLEETARRIRSMQVRCLTYLGDMGNYKDVCGFFQQIETELGSVDILINNAGISCFGLLQDTTPDQWNTMIASNLNSVFYCSKLAIPKMLAKKSGKILTISSVWGNVGASMEVPYSTTKGAINAFTKALAKELGPSNIQVNAIACGMIDTEMNAVLSSEDIDAITEEIPAGRMGTPQEVADLAFAITKKNDYLTGQIITLDGGWI